MSSAVYESKSNSAVHLFPTSINTAVKMIKYQNIAPSTGIENKMRKYGVRDAHASCNVDQTQSVQRRNARERNRVKQVNNSFAKLRQHIPQSIIADLTKGGGRGPQKKVSKVDTLRIAVEYIRRLQSLVDELNNGSSTNSTHEFSTPIKGNAQQQYSKSTPNPSTGYILQQQHQQNFQQQSVPTTILKPICLNTLTNSQTQFESTCHSPTSSFNSSMSFDSGTYESATQLSPEPVPATIDAHLQLKFEPYDHFNLDEEDCTPDDEEILDYISLWQEQ